MTRRDVVLAAALLLCLLAGAAVGWLYVVLLDAGVVAEPWQLRR